MKNKIIFLIITFLTLIIDQVSKFIINNTLTLNEKINIIPNILSFEKVYNTGAAFSILQNNTLLLILISLITLIVIIYFVFKKQISLTETLALGLISGGAFGNMLDRIINSYVIDFIETDFINFPIFNLADTFINIGVIIFIVSMLILKNDK